MTSAPSVLEGLLPQVDAVSVAHRRAPVSPQQVWNAWHSVCGSDVPLVAFLAGVRYFPDWVRGRSPVRWDLHRPIIQLMLGGGFTLVLADEPSALVVAHIGRPWDSQSKPVPFSDVEAFRAFQTPGYVKIAFSFEAREAGACTELVSAVRVQATDAASRRKFRRYWWGVGLGSWLVREVWLRAAVRKARRMAMR